MSTEPTRPGHEMVTSAQIPPRPAEPPSPPPPASGARREQLPEPQMVTLLCIGGPKHGQEVTIPADDKRWLDLASAEMYRRQWFSTTRINALVGRPMQAWRRYALIWDAIPMEQSIPLLADWLIGQWVMQDGEEIAVASIKVAAPEPPNGGTPQ